MEAVLSVQSINCLLYTSGACKPEDMIIFKVLCNRLVHISKLRTMAFIKNHNNVFFINFMFFVLGYEFI